MCGRRVPFFSRINPSGGMAGSQAVTVFSRGPLCHTDFRFTPRAAGTRLPIALWCRRPLALWDPIISVGASCVCSRFPHSKVTVSDCGGFEGFQSSAAWAAAPTLQLLCGTTLGRLVILPVPQFPRL